MKNGKVCMWMNLLGFEMTDEDCGVERFLKDVGFKPDGVHLCLSHPDFFHQHSGMEEEYVLPPDICSYAAVPRNAQRERQPWTNYKIRTLVQKLKERGVDTYASVFGTNERAPHLTFHRIWLLDHLELRRLGRFGIENAYTMSLFPLKRFSDGSYYEDFMAKKVCETLTDYGFKGVHFGDSFSPAVSAPLSWLDFSTDIVEQYLDHTGEELPKELADEMGDDREKAVFKRYSYFYGVKREDWIRFMAWRWNGFFKKMGDALHAKGKEVTTLGMYCTDVFETLYCLGTDLKGITDAGVDCITSNPMATGLFLNGREDEFNRFMSITPFLGAHITSKKFLTMVGLQDSTEEWNIIKDAPCRHIRDIYTILSYFIVDKNGISRACDGFYLCLADGLTKAEWENEKETMEASMSSIDVVESRSPMMFWSENLHNNLLHHYIEHRCWTPFKMFYSLADEGILLNGIVKPDGLEHFSGTLVVPNFDLLSDDEQQLVLNYKKSGVLCFASPEFDLKEKGIDAKFEFEDRFSEWPLKAFVLNCEVDEETKTKIEELLSVDDGQPNLEAPSLELEEYVYVFNKTLRFAKVTDGFVKSMKEVVANVDKCPICSTVPLRVYKMKDGAYRVYVYNDDPVHYKRVIVSSDYQIDDIKVVTKFPLLKPGYADSVPRKGHFVSSSGAESKRNIVVKLQPAGVSVLDLYVNEK